MLFLQGETHMDEHMLTGESAPVAKEVGSAVVGGTLNLANGVVIRATRVGSDTVLQSIARLVANAQLAKAPVQSFADAVSAVCTLWPTSFTSG
jgi:P-type Cu+ transporter